jgi:hypothetical protein
MDPDAADAAQQVAQQAANCRLNETILDLPKFYGTAKDTITVDNLSERIDASVDALAWTPGMAYNYFQMSLYSDAEHWIKLIRETNEEFVKTWDFIKPLFKARFGKKMDVSKVGTVLDNLKMDSNNHVSVFAAKMNNNFSQLREHIPRGQLGTYLPHQPTELMPFARAFTTMPQVFLHRRIT